MSTMKNLFGSSGMGDLFNSQPVEPSKEILDMFKPVDTAVMSEQAQKMAEQHARLIQEGISAGQQAAADANARLEAMKRETQANMEAVLRMQEERRKAEEEAKKEAERKAEEEEKARKEALKELEDAVKDDPLTLVRQDMEALFNSDAYKEAGDVQRRDLINAMATDLEKALREKGLKQELITKSINAFKNAGSQNVDKYIADSEKDDWDPLNDLIKPVISGFKKGQAANAVKDSAIIDKAIADLKAGKEVSGWAVDEILDRDPSLRKYMTNTGVYSSITQGVGSSFKLRAGVADEFSKAAGKTWQSAIDDATNYDKTAKDLDRQRSADTVRHHKNYEYELAKIENDEKSGKIGWFDSMLSQGMVVASNPTVSLDKIAPSIANFIAETATLQGAAGAAGAVVGGIVGGVSGGLGGTAATPGAGTVAGVVAGAVAGAKTGFSIGVGLANGGKVAKYIATGINALRNGMASAEMTEDEIINNTREQLMALDVKNEADLKKLKSLPYWDEMVARSDGNLELAKVRMSAFASQDAAFAGSIVAAATGILGPEAILSKGLIGVIVKSALKKPVVGMAVTGKTAGAVALASALEGGEEAMTQYLTNFATAYGSSDESLTKRIREAMSNDPSLLDGTAGAFAQGAIGGGMVAGIGAGMQLSGDIKTTTEANTAYRIANDATSYNREGVEALKTALTSNDKLDKAFIEETVHKAMRSHTRDLSAYAKYYDATAEQTAQQEVYDNIIEPALEGSQLTTEQTQDIVKKLNLVYDNLNTNKYAIAEETPLLKAMQAETLEEAEKIYGQPLSTLRADTWRVLNNKDTSVVADLEHAQATAEVIRNILQGGGENTIQRSNNVLRTVFGYTDEATNKYHDGILQRYRLDDSKIDAILEMARNDLDAYRRRGLDNEQETKQPSAQTGRHPNGGTVPQDGGPSRSQDTGTVGETATGSQTQDQPTDSTGLGGQDTTGQTTADTQSGRSRGKRQATATQPTTSSTQEADSPATGTTETQGTVPNTDSPTATRPVSETPTVDGGNGPQSQTPEFTGPTNTPTKGTADGSRVTGAKTAERSTDGERTTTTASTDLDAVQNTLSKLSDEEYNILKQFAYALYGRDGFVKSINDVSSLRIAYSFTSLNIVPPTARVARVEQIYRKAGTLAHFTDTELKAYASATVDVYNKVMDLATREYNSSDKKDTPAPETKPRGKRSADGERTTATTEADFEQLKAAIQRLPKEDLASVREFAYFSYKDSANLSSKRAVKLAHMATAMMNISMTDADNRYDSVARVYLSDAAKRYKYDMSEVEALTLNILDLHDILMDAVARGSDGKKTYLGAKKAKPVTEPTAEPTTEPKAKGKGGTSKKKPTATTTDTTPVAEPTTETTATEPKSKPKTKGKLTSTKPTTKRGTKNDEETSTGEQTASTRTDDETSESGSRSDSKPSNEQSGTVREQSTVNDGKKQTAKSTKPDVRQETEVALPTDSTTTKDATNKAEPKKVQLTANIESVYKVIDNVKLDSVSNTVLTTLVNRDKKASNPNTKREIMTDLAVASATNDTTVYEKYAKQYVVNGERTSKKTKLERIKSLADTLWNNVKALAVAVSVSLAALTGTAMTVPVDAQASTTTYTQTVLSQQVKDTASHVVQTKDNDGKPFIVADKLSGNITLFDANGKVLETAGALFGSEVGDTINSAEQRATPAGRFELDYSKASDTKLYGSHTQHLKGTEMTGADGTEYVWAIHRVINPKGENRLNRLSSKTASDNRISNGCINVPAEFFNKHLDKPFDGVLYVLPETANFNGTLFNNSTVSDSTTATEQSGRSASQTGTDSKQTTDKQTDAKTDKAPEKSERTSEQIKNLGTSRLLTDRDLAENVAETLRTTLPDAPAQVSTEPARMSENPSSQTALIDPVTVDGTTYNTASVNEGQTTPAEERADTTFDTLPTTQTSSDGYGVFDIAVALGGLFAVGGVVRFRRKRKNGKVEVVAEVEKGSNDDTTADTVEATEPKPAKEKTKKTKLTSRKKSEKLGFNPDNPTELAKAIREQLYALEDLQTNVQAQNLLMALAGKPNVGSIMYAASYNTMVREINNSFNDRTKAQVDAGFDDEQTLDWRGIRKKGANDDITATNLVAKAFNRYIQFAGGATPTLDTYLKDAGAKRIGILQDSYALSAALAKIPAVRNALFGRFATQMLKPIDREMQKVTFNAEYAKRIRALHGRSPKQGELGYDIAHDFGMYATLQHGLEAWDWFVKSREYTAEEYAKQADKASERIKQDLESKAPHEVEQILELVKAGNHVELEQMFDAYGMTTSMRSRIKTLTSSYGKLTRKAQDIRDETEAIEAYYENESGITGATAYPLPIGMVKADIEAKIKELEDLYGKDDLDKMAKRLYDGYAYAVRDSVMHGGYTAQQLEQIKAPKFKKYVALYKRKEKETDTSGDIYQATELDAWTQAGLTSKEVLTLGLTPDMTRFHREGMTTPPDDAYTNLRSFAQNQMGRAAESELKREMQELAESFDEGQIPFDKLTYDPTKAQDTAIKGIVRIPADTKNGHIPDNLKNVVPIRARGVYYELVQDPNDPKKSTYEPREADFNYYFTDSNIQREITHKSETNEKLKRGMFTGNLYTIQRWQASMMTRLRPVWNFWNFVKEASERTITLLYRPVADEDGKRINSFKLAKDNLENLAKLSTDLEAQAQITNYIMYREVVTPLQRMLAEMDEAGALQLYTSTVDRHNAMDTETKSALDILSEHAHKNAKKLASKYKATEKAMESAEALADWYQTRLVETPQVVNALAVFMTYKQNNVNRKEAANRVRDMFDPLRTQEPLINKLAAFFPFVRSAMAGNYNTARTLDIMTQDRQAMLATVLGVMASFALLGLALAALGDDDETGEPLWERLTFDDLARGVPVRLFGNDVFFVPVGFGMPNLLWSIAAGVFSGINSGFDFQDAVAGISTTAIKNLLPVSLPTGESNSSMKGAILMFMPAMVKPLMEVALNQKAFGGSPIVRNQNIPEGYSKAEVSQWSTPEAYKDMAMTLSSMGIDMHPEQLRHLMQNYFFVGPFRAMDAMLQDKGDKTGGVMMDKGETVGPILTGLGVDISYQPDRFSMRNAFYELQKLEKEILRKYDVREKLSGADTLDDTTEFIGMDGLDDSMIKKDDSNLARIRNELVAKGATLDEVQMVLDIRTANDAYTKANREAGNEAIHYLRGLEKGEFSDVSSPDVYRDKFLAAHYDMQTVVKKHIHLLTED